MNSRPGVKTAEEDYRDYEFLSASTGPFGLRIAHRLNSESNRDGFDSNLGFLMPNGARLPRARKAMPGEVNDPVPGVGTRPGHS